VEKIVFDRRFRGPPESANGGYGQASPRGCSGVPRRFAFCCRRRSTSRSTSNQAAIVSVSSTATRR
jgi:hypothetical protein